MIIMKQLQLKSKEEKGLKIRFNLKQVREKNKLTQIMLITTVNREESESIPNSV